ncbi:HD domain-containing protein [Kyrpidia sp.]|uniref:HD domain-containing protein n=1 Tax=Kyrpidia sp. TaxID=2073077 RepID=UPI002582987C|nr:HD domain-containing protein [Kyrpidia sp.]MCL6577667.1 HD domain-containing protein [Kyrpidia sp.]
MSEADLALALRIAKQAHAGQTDKGGWPYIEHPLAVASMVHGSKEKIVALLHDVCEDSDIALEDLRAAGFDDDVIEAVRAITKMKGESYDAYLARVAANPIARAVKIADLRHNCDLSRISNPGPSDFARVKRYQAAIRTLSAAGNDGW